MTTEERAKEFCRRLSALEKELNIWLMATGEECLTVDDAEATIHRGGNDAWEWVVLGINQNT